MAARRCSSAPPTRPAKRRWSLAKRERLMRIRITEVHRCTSALPFLPVQMAKDDDRAREEFTSEAEELLDTLSRDLVELESQGASVRPEVINKIFREVHSLKGLAGMLGFGEISELSHNLEDMLDRLRMGKIAIDKELIDLLYDSVDSLNRLVIAINASSIAGLIDITGLTRRIHHVVTNQP